MGLNHNDINFTYGTIIIQSLIIIYEGILGFLKNVLCLLMCLVNTHLNSMVRCFGGCWRTAKSIASAPENNLLSFVVQNNDSPSTISGVSEIIAILYSEQLSQNYISTLFSRFTFVCNLWLECYFFK